MEIVQDLNVRDHAGGPVADLEKSPTVCRHLLFAKFFAQKAAPIGW
jgi:hypothetical protein